jgi:hemin uptake protein HemP
MQRDSATRRRSTALPSEATTKPRAPLRRIDSQTLLGSAQEIEITHLDQIYRLRRTALGKLILTK